MGKIYANLHMYAYIKKPMQNCTALFLFLYEEQSQPRASHALTRAYSGLQMRALFLSEKANRTLACYLLSRQEGTLSHRLDSVRLH